MFTTPLPSNSCMYLFHNFGLQLSCHSIITYQRGCKKVNSYLPTHPPTHLPTYLPMYLWLYNPLLGLGPFFSFLIFYTVGRIPWTKDQPITRLLPAHRTEETEYMHTDIHASSGIQINNPSVWAGEHSSYLRLRGHCDWQVNFTDIKKPKMLKAEVNWVSYWYISISFVASKRNMSTVMTDFQYILCCLLVNLSFCTFLSFWKHYWHPMSIYWARHSFTGAMLMIVLGVPVRPHQLP
jgi:hypothetical protein